MHFLELLVGLTLGLGPVDVPASSVSELPAAIEVGPAPEPVPSGDRGLLMSLLERTRVGAWMERERLTVSGWTDLSFTPSTASRNQLPMGFNYLANDFLLQQNWLRIDRAIDPESNLPSFGYRFDTILPGSDYRFTQARGLWDAQSGRYGIDPVQFYGEAYFPGVGQGASMKLGRFFAPYGVESIAAPDTPLASRSYTFIYNPFTQTGLLGALKLNDRWSIKSGITTGNDVFIDPASSPYFVGGVVWTSDDGDTSIDFTTILGSGRFNAGENFHNPQIFDVVLTRRLTERTTWKLDALYGFTNDVPGIDFANWYGIVNYLIHDWTDQLATTLRLEFFDDCQGQRTGTSGLYTAITAGQAYKLKPWLWLRPEVRLDHSNHRPFDGKSTLFTAGLDVLIRW
ncbi:MAG: outer membrane beta-barrel protein [Myxococcota bacterium]